MHNVTNKYIAWKRDEGLKYLPNECSLLSLAAAFWTKNI